MDASDDETYWPLGLYLKQDDAIAAASRPPDEWGSDGTPEDGEYARLEIKLRKVGWDSWGGKAVWSQGWSNEAVGEEYKWVPRAPKVNAIDQAGEAHGRLGHPHVTSAHLVLGLLTLQGSVGDTVLKRAGRSTESVERYLSSKHIATEEAVEQEGALFCRSAINALARAEPEAAAFSHTILGVEHLTLALLAEERGDAADLFVSVHIDRDKTRQIMLQELP